MVSADAFELKAQALNNDSRLKKAGIAALKFTGDKKYIADGEFASVPPPPAAATTATKEIKATSASGKGLRVVLRMPNDDSYELKAQALNNDSRLKKVGIAALKFTGDKRYIADGDFSLEPLPPEAPTTAPPKNKSTASGQRLRVILRIPNDDSYELKAQALNNDPRLKDAGIAALKYVGDNQYISEGEFTPELPSPTPDKALDKKVRVTLRVPRKDAYELLVKHLNNDPRLIKAGISGMGLAKGAGMVPVAKETPAKPQKRKRSFRRVLFATVIIGIIGIAGFFGIVGAGAFLFFKPPAPTSTAAPIIPVSGGDATKTDTPLPPTETQIPTNTKVASTNTKRPTATNTQPPTATVVSCQPPSEAIVTAENLSCRYGPGAIYLYRAGFAKNDVVDVLGKADTAFGTWIRVQSKFDESIKCWISSSPKFVEIPQGDVACLDSLYPEKAPLILFNTDLFPKPYNVKASRSGNLVYIDWVGYDLLPGDKPDQSPRYLVEAWTCQDGEFVFTPLGMDETYTQVRDDGGCDQASYGYVYMAHVDGYIGPVTIPWPP